MSFANRVLVFFVLMPLSHWGLAQGNDPIASRLDKAKESYEAKVAVYRDQVTKRLDDGENRAVKLGNKELVDLIEKERAAFNQIEVVPTSVNVADLVARRDASRRLLVTAYNRAIQDYTKTSQRDLATKVENELKVVLKYFEQSNLGGIREWDKKVVRLVNLATGMVLEARRTPDAVKNDLVAGRVRDDSSQLWLLKRHTDAEQYQLLNRQFKNMAVNVPRNRATHGQKLQVYVDYKGAPNELWSINPAGTAYQLISDNGLAMAVGAPQDGAPIVQVNPSGSKAELWTIDEVQGVD